MGFKSASRRGDSDSRKLYPGLHLKLFPYLFYHRRYHGNVLDLTVYHRPPFMRKRLGIVHAENIIVHMTDYSNYSTRSDIQRKKLIVLLRSEFSLGHLCLLIGLRML